MRKLTILIAWFISLPALALSQDKVKDYYSDVTELELGEDTYIVHKILPIKIIPSRWPNSISIYNKLNLPGGTVPKDRRTGKSISRPQPVIDIDSKDIKEVFDEVFPGCTYSTNESAGNAIVRLAIGFKIDPVSMEVLEVGFGIGATDEYKSAAYSIPPSLFHRLELLIKERVKGSFPVQKEYYSDDSLNATFLTAGWTIYLSPDDLQTECWKRVLR